MNVLRIKLLGPTIDRHLSHRQRITEHLVCRLNSLTYEDASYGILLASKQFENIDIPHYFHTIS